MKTKKIKVYADPQHAWAKVLRSELVALNIADKISPYSYERKTWVYLEEDSDLSKYCEALKFKGITPVFKESHTNRQSKIRNYQSYTYQG